MGQCAVCRGDLRAWHWKQRQRRYRPRAKSLVRKKRNTSFAGTIDSSTGAAGVLEHPCIRCKCLDRLLGCCVGVGYLAAVLPQPAGTMGGLYTKRKPAIIKRTQVAMHPFTVPCSSPSLRQHDRQVFPIIWRARAHHLHRLA